MYEPLCMLYLVISKCLLMYHCASNVLTIAVCAVYWQAAVCPYSKDQRWEHSAPRLSTGGQAPEKSGTLEQMYSRTEGRERQRSISSQNRCLGCPAAHLS